MKSNNFVSTFIGPLRCDDMCSDDLINELSFTRKNAKCFFYVNTHCLNFAFTNSKFRDAMNSSYLSFCDGCGIKFLSFFFSNYSIRNRNTPPDFIDAVYQKIYKQGGKVFLLGNTKKKVGEYFEKINALYPGLVAGYYHGFFDIRDNDLIVDAINRVQPRLLLVGMGVPDQEEFVIRNIGILKACNVLTVGDLFSWSHDRKKVPRWLTDNGFEWLFRLFNSPVRLWRRYLLGLPEVLIRLFLKKNDGNE
jgi:N-acetylglucosaminyldiphosphoundecaprenol N-acetyl-beta-D-mannosaminyltransferase